MDRSAADMTGVGARPLGQGLRVFVAGLNVLDAARCVLAVAALLLVLVTLEPFPDLRNADLATAASGRMALSYIAFAGLAAAAVLLTFAQDAPSLKTLVTPLHLCFIGWMLINLAVS